MCVCVCVCVYSILPSVYLKLHVVHEIIVSYMAPFLGANISSKILSHQKKKKKKVYCNVFGMVSPLVFGIKK